MELETQPSDDDSNGNVARDGDLSTGSQEEDPSLAQPAENGDESSEDASISASSQKKNDQTYLPCQKTRKITG